MDNWQLLLGVNAILITSLGFFIKSWIGKMEKKLDGKLDAVLCGERHERSSVSCDKLFRHRHAPSLPDSRGGEVIIP